jgi:hypothetical protein
VNEAGRDRSQRLRLLFWNVYLLQPRLIPGGPPLPAIRELSAPAVTARAGEIAAELPGQYDVVAFAEAFDPQERRRVLSGWATGPAVAAVAGPERTFPPGGPLTFASSGLFTIIDGHRVVRTDQHRFDARGERPWDADAWSNKGVLLVELDPWGTPGDAPDSPATAGHVELYSTHLFWGGGMLPGPRADDHERRHMVRMAQTDELLAFVERTHRPENVAVIVGDFNVRVHDVDRPEQPNHWYEDLADRMARFDLVDTWAAAGVGPGHTCGGERDPFDEDDPDDPGRLLDDPSEPEGRPDRERIDFCWVQRSTPDHSIDVSFERPRRRAFHRTAGAKRRDLLPRMSDHLALEVTLDVRARTA